MIQSWTMHPHWGMRITPIIGNRDYIWLYNSDLHTHYIAGFPLWYRWPSTYTTLWLVLTMDHGTCTNHVEWIAVLLAKLRCRRLGASRFGMDWGHCVSQWIHELTSLEFTGHDSVYASYTCLLHPLTLFGNIIFTLYIYICASCFLADATAPTTCRGRLSSSLYGRVHTASRITPAKILARSRLTQSCTHGWLNLASSRANQVGAFTQICCRIS